MVKRKLYNKDQPLTLPNGTILSNTDVAFVMINSKGKPCSTIDNTTGETVGGVTYVRTDNNGEFEVSLFPNSRGAVPTFYLVRAMYDGFSEVTAAMPDGIKPIKWLEFVHGGIVIPELDLDVVRAIIDDTQTSVEYTWSSEKILQEINSVNSGSSYTFTQSVASPTWEIAHNLNKDILVQIEDTDGNEVEGDLDRTDSNTLTITFSEPVAGKAFIK